MPATDIPRIAPSTIVQMCAQVRADIVDDVERREGLPLTGQNVAEAVGEMCAQIDALCVMVGALARVVQER